MGAWIVAFWRKFWTCFAFLVSLGWSKQNVYGLKRKWVYQADGCQWQAWPVSGNVCCQWKARYAQHPPQPRVQEAGNQYL